MVSSWAMYRARKAHEFLVDRCKLPGSRLHDRCEPIHLEKEPAHVVYVDNFCAFSKTKDGGGGASLSCVEGSLVQ